KFLNADKLIKSLPTSLSGNLDSKFTGKLIDTQEIKTSLTTFKKHPDIMYTTKLINRSEIIYAYSKSNEIVKADSRLYYLSIPRPRTLCKTNLSNI
ncbi:17923_t:CDS:2, partial [Gigaspora margarita]